MRRSYCFLVVSTLSTVLAASPAGATHVAGYCDTGIPTDEVLGFNSFPRGDVFCSLVADPKSDGSFLSYVRGTSSSAFGTDLGSVGIGDRLGLARWNGPQLGEGVQLSLVGEIYSQFDLNAPSYDLINADYTIGLPITLRRGPVSGRVRLYHQSSHLGDEFVLRGTTQRENFAFESIETILSVDLGPLRTYGGGEYLFGRTPENVVSKVAHGGVELREGGGLTAAGRLSRVRLVAALDVKSSDELDWSVAWSGRAGFEVGRTPGAEHRSRRWSLLGEYYDGPSPYGQFFRDEVRYYGVGLHLGP
jgi:uncharacterized protein DUF1207